MGTVEYRYASKRRDKDPHVSLEVLEYLEETFTIDYLVNQPNLKTGEETVGFIKGAREVIGNLRGLYEEQN